MALENNKFRIIMNFQQANHRICCLSCVHLGEKTALLNCESVQEPTQRFDSFASDTSLGGANSRLC